MTTVVLPLSAGSTVMSVSLFRSWSANRSCLVMFGGRILALERILATCLRRLSARSDGSKDKLVLIRELRGGGAEGVSVGRGKGEVTV